jgi:hypothetical protein
MLPTRLRRVPAIDQPQAEVDAGNRLIATRDEQIARRRRGGADAIRNHDSHLVVAGFAERVELAAAAVTAGPAKMRRRIARYTRLGRNKIVSNSEEFSSACSECGSDPLT